MSIKIKSIAAAAVIAISTGIGASTASANPAAGTVADTNAGVQNVAYFYGGYRGHRRCHPVRYRVPVYRWVRTWGGWRKVFVGYRTKVRYRCHRRHYRPRFRFGVRF